MAAHGLSGYLAGAPRTRGCRRDVAPVGPGRVYQRSILRCLCGCLHPPPGPAARGGWARTGTIGCIPGVALHAHRRVRLPGFHPVASVSKPALVADCSNGTGTPRSGGPEKHDIVPLPMGPAAVRRLCPGTHDSAVRIVQGAHFLSHAFWAAAVCWVIAALVFSVRDRLVRGWKKADLNRTWTFPHSGRA